MPRLAWLSLTAASRAVAWRRSSARRPRPCRILRGCGDNTARSWRRPRIGIAPPAVVWRKVFRKELQSHVSVKPSPCSLIHLTPARRGPSRKHTYTLLFPLRRVHTPQHRHVTLWAPASQRQYDRCVAALDEAWQAQTQATRRPKVKSLGASGAARERRPEPQIANPGPDPESLAARERPELDTQPVLWHRMSC